MWRGELSLDVVDRAEAGGDRRMETLHEEVGFL